MIYKQGVCQECMRKRRLRRKCCFANMYGLEVMYIWLCRPCRKEAFDRG